MPFVTGYPDVHSAVKAFRAGALDFLLKPVKRKELLACVKRALQESRQARESRRAAFEGVRQETPPTLIGESEPWRKALEHLPEVAESDSPVLLLGESGTGKDVVARAIHARSPRAERPFVAVNAAALPPTLLESTLFGYKKGAFTGAVSDRQGLFEAADGGSLFLDEIGEMPADLQAKLLRVIEDLRVTRVGDVVEIPVDVRIIAATNRNLATECDSGRFRKDLYYRLDVFAISLPPLRARPDDIPVLASHLLNKRSVHAGGVQRAIRPEAIEKLRSYPWPGNVRELDNVIQRAVMLSKGAEIGPEHVLLGQETELRDSITALAALSYKDALSRFEERYFATLLARVDGNKTKAAAMADIDRTVLYDHLKNLKLDTND